MTDKHIEVEDLVNSIILKVQKLNNKELSEDVQRELAEIIYVVQRIRNLLEDNKAFVFGRLGSCFRKINNDDEKSKENQKLEPLLEWLHLAVDKLSQEKPSTLLATNIRRKLDLLISRYENPLIAPITNLLKKINYLSSTPAKVLIGLALALPFYLSLPTITIVGMDQVVEQTYVNKNVSKDDLTAYKENIALIVLVGCAGALGSCVSILTRINEYVSRKYEDSFLPVFIGAFKPLIGASFAILIFTLVSSNILPIDVENQDQPGRRLYFFYSIAFLIGFSERFANDVVSRAENIIIGDRNLGK